jgi:hypothetical protein
LRNITAELEGKRHSVEVTTERRRVRAIKRDLELKFGLTRKTHNREAAENAAIWVLAGAVRHITGKPHYSQVADLAEVLLGKGAEVSLERVRHVVRERRRRYCEPVDTQKQ